MQQCCKTSGRNVTSFFFVIQDVGESVPRRDRKSGEPMMTMGSPLSIALRTGVINASA